MQSKIIVAKPQILLPGPRMGLKGTVKNVQVLEHGKVVWESGEFDNLILNQGLDQVASNYIANLFQYCAVGTGNTTPANTDTGLVAEVSRTANYQTAAGFCGTTNPTPNTIQMQRTYDFPAGALNGNFSELGFSSNSSAGGNLFSRVLIQSGGVPTVVTITSAQQLRVVYQLTITFPSTSAPFNLNFGGSWGVVTGNMAVQTCIYSNKPIAYVDANGYTASDSGFNYLEPVLNVSTGVSDSTAALAPVGSAVTRQGSVFQYGTLVKAAYTNGNYYIDKTVTYSTSQANINNLASIVIGDIINQNYQVWAALLTTPKNKTNLGTLSLTIRTTWGRN